MRILIDARPLVDQRSGGVSRVARALIEAYVTRNAQDDIVFITTGLHAPPPLLLSQPSHCRHIHLRIPNKLWSLLCALQLTSLDRAAEKRVGKIDVLFLPNLGFVGNLIRPYTLLLHDLSFVIEPHWFSFKTRWWHTAVGAKRRIRQAKYLLSVSNQTKTDTVRLLNIPEEKIAVIPLGLSQLHSKDTSTQIHGIHGRFILILGQGDARKNSATAIKAVELLKCEPTFQDLKIVIVGKTFNPTDKELSTLYAAAAAFLYPSWYEGYGLPLHEAAVYGTPCIASTAGALPETAPLGTLFVDPAKQHQWTEALRQVLKYPELCRTTEAERSWNEAAEKLNESLQTSDPSLCKKD